jgi:short-subunit dehydrogenase
MTEAGLAVVTGASSGIGYQLARCAVEDGYALLICSDEPEIETAAEKLRRLGGEVQVVRADLATRAGVDALWAAMEDQPVDLFFANVGRALGRAFHEQEWSDIRIRVDLNIVQTTVLLHRVGRRMRARGRGRILVTGSIAGFVPGPFDAVYNATKAYLDSLAYALRDEWRDGPVTITCLMPGLTETRIFSRPSNALADTPIARQEKDDAADVARAGYAAMMNGEAGVVPGLTNKVLTMLSGVVPDGILARIHRAAAEPE